MLTIHTGTGFATGGWYAGPADRALGLLHARIGDDRLADEALAAALALQQKMDSPPWVARTALDWAEVRLARGDRPGAAELSATAADAIRALDLPESERRLAALRVRLGT